jgi:hypothetical protein
MSPFEGIRRKVRHGAEIVHLRSNHNLKGDLTLMENDELIRYQRSTRRAKSGSVFGAVITTAISHSFPLFMPSAGIKIIQTINTAKDRHRVKREIKARKQRDGDFDKELSRKDKPTHDVITGSAITTATIGLTYGIIGGDNALDALSQVAHHTGGEHIGNVVAGHHLDHAINQSHASYGHQLTDAHQGSSSSTVATNNHPHPRSDLFKVGHPDLAHLDGDIHKVVNGVGDAINQKLSHTTHIAIQDDTTWDVLKAELHTTNDIAAAAAQIGGAGIANESTTPLLVVEPAVDRIVEQQSEKKRLRVEELAAGHVNKQNAARGYGMSLAERQKQTKLLSDNAAELRKTLVKRQLMIDR